MSDLERILTAFMRLMILCNQPFKQRYLRFGKVEPKTIKIFCSTFFKSGKLKNSGYFPKFLSFFIV